MQLVIKVNTGIWRFAPKLTLAIRALFIFRKIRLSQKYRCRLRGSKFSRHARWFAPRQTIPFAAGAEAAKPLTTRPENRRNISKLCRWSSERIASWQKTEKGERRRWFSRLCRTSTRKPPSVSASTFLSLTHSLALTLASVPTALRR